MRKKKISEASLEENNAMHIVARLAIANPKVIAENLLFEAFNKQTDIFRSFARLLEANRNESGKNIS